MAILITIIKHVTEGEDDMYGIWEEENNVGFKAARGASSDKEVFYKILGERVYNLGQGHKLEFAFFEAHRDISPTEIENMSLRKRLKAKNSDISTNKNNIKTAV